eukprot:6550003-Pyramimonas_sp.AAC.1
MISLLSYRPREAGPPSCPARGLVPCRPERRGLPGSPVGVVYRAQGPALGSWEVQPPAACDE